MVVQVLVVAVSRMFSMMTRGIHRHCRRHWRHLHSLLHHFVSSSSTPGAAVREIADALLQMIRLEERLEERGGGGAGGGSCFRFAADAAAVAAAVTANDDVLVDATRMFFLFTRPIRFVERGSTRFFEPDLRE